MHHWKTKTVTSKKLSSTTNSHTEISSLNPSSNNKPLAEPLSVRPSMRNNKIVKRIKIAWGKRGKNSAEEEGIIWWIRLIKVNWTLNSLLKKLSVLQNLQKDLQLLFQLLSLLTSDKTAQTTYPITAFPQSILFLKPHLFPVLKNPLSKEKTSPKPKPKIKFSQFHFENSFQVWIPTQKELITCHTLNQEGKDLWSALLKTSKMSKILSQSNTNSSISSFESGKNFLFDCLIIFI